MYYVYIIKSKKRKWHYVGFTENIERRIKSHNSGKIVSTKYYKPFILVFVQIVKDRKNARDLEKYLKVNYYKEVVLEMI